MKLDRANRVFAAFLGVCVAALALIGAATCALVAILSYRLQHDGVGAIGGADARWALAFLIVLGIGSLLAALSLWRQVLATHRLVRLVAAQRLPVPRRLAAAAARAELSSRVDFVDSEERFSFTYSISPPRVAVSRGLYESVSERELDAVLEHERYHVDNNDPLKIALTRTLVPALPLLPALRDLRAGYAASRELAADRRAMKRHGRAALTGALAKAVAGPAAMDLEPAAAVGDSETIDARLTQLEIGTEPSVAHLRLVNLLLSVMGVGVMVALFAGSVAAFGGLGELARRVCGGA